MSFFIFKFTGELQQLLHTTTLTYSKTIRKHLTVFGENDSFCLSMFLETQVI